MGLFRIASMVEFYATCTQWNRGTATEWCKAAIHADNASEWMWFRNCAQFCGGPL